MSQQQRYQRDFRPEIDYNTLVKQALLTIIELPKISDFASENIPQAGIMRSSSRFSPERFDRAVRTACFMLVKRMRDDEYDKILKGERDPEKLWQALMELLDRSGFWQRTKSVSNL
jgi:hypothetical protein